MLGATGRLISRMHHTHRFSLLPTGVAMSPSPIDPTAVSNLAPALLSVGPPGFSLAMLASNDCTNHQRKSGLVDKYRSTYEASIYARPGLSAYLQHSHDLLDAPLAGHLQGRLAVLISDSRVRL